MIKNNRNNEQIYGRNDMIMLDQNNKIYGSRARLLKYAEDGVPEDERRFGKGHNIKVRLLCA